MNNVNKLQIGAGQNKKPHGQKLLSCVRHFDRSPLGAKWRNLFKTGFSAVLRFASPWVCHRQNDMSKRSVIARPGRRSNKIKLAKSFTSCPLSSVFCLLFSVLCVLSGCAPRMESQGQQINAPREIAASSLPSWTDKAKVMEIAEDVLTDMYFTIDKLDPNSGFIKTRPLPGAQFFEFWRSDNIGSTNWINSNLHSIRRTVEVNISQQAPPFLPSQENRGVDINCVVKIQRLSLPARQVVSSARAYEMFSRSSPALQTLQLNPEQERKMAWIDLGTDTELETEILKRIENKYENLNPKNENENKH